MQLVVNAWKNEIINKQANTTHKSRATASLPRRPIVLHRLLPVLEPLVRGDGRRRRLRDGAHRLAHWPVLEIRKPLLVCCLGAVIHLSLIHI